MLRRLTEYLVQAAAREELVAPLKEVLDGFLKEASGLLAPRGIEIRKEEGTGVIGPSWVDSAFEAVDKEAPQPESIVMSTRVWVTTEDRDLVVSLRDDLEETLETYGFSVWQASGLVIVELPGKKVALVGFCRQKATEPTAEPKPTGAEVTEGEGKSKNVFA
jgi:hypothetical protein